MKFIAMIFLMMTVFPAVAEDHLPWSNTNATNNSDIQKRWEEVLQHRSVYRNVENIMINNQNIPLFEIGFWESEGDLVSWLLNLAPLLSEISNNTQWEVCGVIEKNLNGHRLRVYSNGSSLLCAPPARDGVMIHTHPSVGAVSTNHWERSLGWSGIAITEPHDFSDIDLSLQEGWLITPNGRLLHQIHGHAHDHDTIPGAAKKAFACPHSAWNFF